MGESFEKVQSFVAIVRSLRIDELFDLFDDEVERVEVNTKMVVGGDSRDHCELCTSNDGDL